MTQIIAEKDSGSYIKSTKICLNEHLDKWLSEVAHNKCFINASFWAFAQISQKKKEKGIIADTQNY